MAKYQSRCYRCQHSIRLFKENDVLMVDCSKEGTRKARAWRARCEDFDEKFDFVLDMSKPENEWKWAPKVN